MNCNLQVVLATCLLAMTVGYEIVQQKALEVDTYIESLRKTLQIPSLSLAITSNNGTYAKAYGFRNLERNLSSNAETLFAIGSVTKSMASILIGIELKKIFPELGERVLDTPIIKLAPRYPLVLRDRYRTEHVTFRDLLSHRVCTQRLDFPGRNGAFNSTSDMLFRERYAKEVCGFRDGTTTDFGEQYNNVLYTLAWDVVESLTNKTFDQAASSFFTSVGMLRSTVVKSTDSDIDETNRALPYHVYEGQTYLRKPDSLKYAILVAPAATALSSASDMLTYLQLHLNAGKVRGSQVIPEDVMVWPRRVSNAWVRGVFKSPNTSVANHVFGYGLGLGSQDYDGWLGFGHDGGISSFSSNFMFYPELKFGVFFSFSGGDYTNLNMDYVMAILFDIFNGNGNPRPAMSNELQKNTKSRPSESMGKHNKMEFQMKDKKLPGRYGSAMLGDLTITPAQRSNGTSGYYMNYGQYGRAWLERRSPYSFVIVPDETYSGYPQNPSTNMEFQDQDHFVFYSPQTGDKTEAMEREFNLSNLPTIPWDDKC